ncbi:MAG: hypothetical protein Q4C52_05250 [Eubacteriales bacterium]|nr:hypothetical protein [Eubacteriales bacterium]
MESKHIKISFSGITFNIDYACPVVVTKHFIPFLEGDTEIQYNVEFREIETLPVIEGDVLAHKLEYQVFRTPEGIVRQFHDPVNGDRPYAVTTCDWPNRRILVQYIRGAEEFICETGNSFFHVGWEKVLLREARMILHAACVDTAYGGILFSGPSGAGKSTQADLWCQYADAVLVNGDRPVLGKKKDGWRAYGSPYAGSSRCHKNIDCGIQAVVEVKKSQYCRIRKLSVKEAFRKIYAEATVNSWDAEFVSEISNLIMEFVSEISVYEMECTPDIQAVELLKKILSGEDGI